MSGSGALSGTLTVASWNINSVRARLALLARLIADHAPDVICLQETKVADDAFPHAPFAAHGYVHRLVNGRKTHHGVAILSRHALIETARRQWCARDDGRHLAARLADGTEIHNFYVPAGGDVPDPDVNDKFAHKLAFLDEMAAHFAALDGAAARLIVGDLNIAPLPSDVWSHTQLVKVVSHTPVEVAALARVQAAGSFVDAVRRDVPADQRIYSWWSYRARDWAASDRGRRLDHAWASPTLAARIVDVRILRAARGWPRASDHVPVLVTIRP